MQPMSGRFGFWYKSAADVVKSSLTVRKRLVNPYLRACFKNASILLH